MISLAQSKPIRQTLKTSFAWTLVGNIVYAASQWGVLIVLARLGTPEHVGQFSLGLAVAAPVILFANLQLRVVQVTDANDDYTFSDYLGTRLLTTLIAYLVIVGLVMVSGYSLETSLAVLFIGAAKSFEAISDIFFAVCQRHLRMDRVGKSLMIEGPVTLLVVGTLMAVTHNIVIATAGIALVWLLQLIFYDIPSGWIVLRQAGQSAQAIRPRFHRQTFVKLVSLALPLGFSMLLISLNTNLPRYILERFSGTEQLGLFSSVTYLVMVGNIIVSALGQTISPKLAACIAVGDWHTYNTLLLRAIGLILIISITGLVLAWVLGAQLLTLIYGHEYASLSSILMWIVLAAGIGYIGSVLGYGISATRQYHLFSIPYLILAAGTLGASWLLIPPHGVLGAAWVMCISAFGSCIIPLSIMLQIRRINVALKTATY